MAPFGTRGNARARQRGTPTDAAVLRAASGKVRAWDRTTVDVSEDGVRFESTHRFICGQVLTLRLVFRHIAGDYTHIDLTGVVLRVEESGETFVVAVRVDEIHLD